MATPEPAEPGLLVAEPLVRTEIKIEYARVSTSGQKLERQLDALTAAGCRKLLADKKSGKNALRPELKACHAFLDPGDTLVVPSLDRYGRSLQDLINVVAELRTRGIGFTSLHENLDTTTPGGRLRLPRLRRLGRVHPRTHRQIEAPTKETDSSKINLSGTFCTSTTHTRYRCREQRDAVAAAGCAQGPLGLRRASAL
ncbi:recombinase family protein [Streptomyces sp. NPDC057298]|uniref:recombinase family protein n=1 Tax=Streptomyces sp. NPDC057298 TaxID=3346091 RepID=UPI00362DD30D